MGTSRPVASSGAVDVQRNVGGPIFGGRTRLEGARALVLVAQPWDFQSLHGRGRLLGHIVEALDYGLGGGELRLEIRPQVIEAGQGEVALLRVLPLHGGAKDQIDRLLQGESVGVRLYAAPRRGAAPLLGALRLLI